MPSSRSVAASSAPGNTLFLGLLVVYGFVLVVSIVMFARRRHLQPLRCRNPYLLVSQLLASYLNCVSLGLVTEHIGYVIGHSIQLLFFAMLILTTAHVWAMALRSYAPGRGLAHRLQQCCPVRRVWTAALGALAVLALVQLALCLASPGGVLSWNLYAFNSTVLMLWWALTAVLALDVCCGRRRNDRFVCHELAVLLVLNLFTNVFVIVWLGQRGIDSFFRCATTALSLLRMMVETWFPIWKSFMMATTTATTTTTMAGGIRLTPPADLSLDEVLRTPGGFQALKRFLTLERSVENLLCWQALHDLAVSAAAGPGQFDLVYDTFVRDGAPHQVNISSQVKNRFREALEGRDAAGAQPDAATAAEERAGLLRQLDDEVQRLIQHDSFTRFRKTSSYRHLLLSRPCSEL